MSRKKLKINISPLGFMDLLAFKKLVPIRKNRIATASPRLIEGVPPVNSLAEKMHPKRQHLVIADVKDETPYAKTFRLVPDGNSTGENPAVFRPGQYVSVYVEVNGVTVTRPYSLSSSPAEALEGYYEITIKKNISVF